MKLNEYATLGAIIKLKTGLHIGTGEKEERGAAIPIMESLRNRMPYIPGSSLKGKMRCLLEQSYGRKRIDQRNPGSPCCCGNCQICLLFGSGSSDTTKEPTRLIFRDCYLTKESNELIEKIGLEEKPGVSIDRNSGKATRGALFPMKRIPEGIEFNFEVSVRIFDKDDKNKINELLSVGLYLMEQDALGGGGTRGSGQIEFFNIVFDGKNFNDNWRQECKSIKDKLTI
jgi:CRISPR-associated protein Csm3